MQLVARKHGSQNAQRRMHLGIATRKSENSFQHTAAQRRLRLLFFHRRPLDGVSTHSHPKVAAEGRSLKGVIGGVSTHSRPKAAAKTTGCKGEFHSCFNTQPREGGCTKPLFESLPERGFNTQPREGGCLKQTLYVRPTISVSTHSRAKAAANGYLLD